MLQNIHIHQLKKQLTSMQYLMPEVGKDWLVLTYFMPHNFNMIWQPQGELQTLTLTSKSFFASSMKEKRYLNEFWIRMPRWRRP